jgi:hypothetical protein
MTLEQLLAELRGSVLDDEVLPYLWSDEKLVAYLNDAVRQVCLRARARVESVDPDICRLTLAADQRLAELHPSVIAVRSVRFAGQCERPTGTTMKRLTRCEPGWEDAESDTVPRWWVPDYQDGHLCFAAPPDAELIAWLSVWRVPTEDELLTVDDLQSEPAVPVHWHQDLVDWAAYRAFSSKDTEMRDDARASQYAAAFETKVGRLPSMTEIRLWGVSPIVGVPAEFI